MHEDSKFVNVREQTINIKGGDDQTSARLMVRDFPKSPNQPNEMALTICNSISLPCFWLMRDWKLESFVNGKKISTVPLRTEKEEYL